MSSYVLVPGAGGRGWYWHRLVDELVRGGHRATAVDLPGPDAASGLRQYRDIIVAAVEREPAPVLLVAQSLGAFSAPLACEAVPVEGLILVNPMIPRPGETAGQWWDAVGWQDAARASAEREGRPEPDVTDLETVFYHDVPADIAEVMRADPDGTAEAQIVFGQPWPLHCWPDVPTTVLSGRDDRLFPIELQRRVASQRLRLEVEELAGGHLLALSQPVALARRLARES